MTAEQTAETANLEASINEAWREHRRHVLNVAYRMLGSVSESEDIVQEAFTRLLRADLGGIDDIRGWLVVVVSRLCLDHLRSARMRHEAYVGPWLPEPLIPPAGGELDPADRITLDDTVRMALLVVLERLSPAERVALILHDVFQYDFVAVASIMGRSPLACRQLASRARRHVQAEQERVRFDVDPVEAERVADRFIAAASTGDLGALLSVLDPEAAGETDSGGLFPAAPSARIVGRERVAKRLLGFLKGFNVTLRPMPVNAGPGALAYTDGKLLAVLAIQVSGGVIVHIHSVANPSKLDYVRSLLPASE